MADVPLGMFLSGGIDSSAIAAIMATMIDRPLQTFSVAFKDRAFNELEYAREVARTIGAVSHEIVIDDQRLLRRAAEAGVARGRADRPSVERPAVFRVGARAPARHRRPDRRRQRRAARRLRQVPARVVELARRDGLRAHDAGGDARRRLRAASCRGCPAGWPAMRSRSFLAMDRSPESMFFDNFASIRLADQQRLLAPGAARGGHTRRRVRLVARLFQRAERHEHAARSPALRGHQDVSRRAADEAGPDEHGRRRSRAACRSSITSWSSSRRTLPDEWKLSGWTTKRILRESMKGAAAGVDSQPAEDGIPGAVRAAGRAGRGTASRATCCSTAARVSAA